MMRGLAQALASLVLLLVSVSVVLFFLLRLTGDPAIALAGMDATPEQVAEIRASYGLDQPLPVQFVNYFAKLVQFDFGASLATEEPALSMVAKAAPPTLLLAFGALISTILIALPLGAWLGAREGGALRGGVNALLFVLQGTPGFVAALLLIQVFAIALGVLPSFGLAGPLTWILPIATLTAFMAPQAARMIAANLGEAMRSDYVRTARAIGADGRALILRHALPNALIGVIALLGAQTAFLLSGAVITESIFGWPGLGALLINATQALDFPVIQALAFVIAIFVFAANGLAEWLTRRIDPRLRDGARA
jgi:peptide/nickel transport system permease protein